MRKVVWQTSPKSAVDAMVIKTFQECNQIVKVKREKYFGQYTQ